MDIIQVMLFILVFNFNYKDINSKTRFYFCFKRYNKMYKCLMHAFTYYFIIYL